MSMLPRAAQTFCVISHRLMKYRVSSVLKHPPLILQHQAFSACFISLSVTALPPQQVAHVAPARARPTTRRAVAQPP